MAQVTAFALYHTALRTNAHDLLFAAFDSAAAIRADLVLFERDEPEAPAALRQWAASRGRTVVERDVALNMTVLSVATWSCRHIDVHLKPEVIL